MSFQAVEAARAIRGIPSTDKLVLLILSSYAGMDNGLWPSQEIIAEDTCLSLRAVQSSLVRLEGGGFIKRDKRYTHGSRTTDWITILFIPAPDARMRGAKPASGDVHTRTSRRSKAHDVQGNSNEKEEKSAREAPAVQRPASRAFAEPKPRRFPMRQAPTETPAEMAARLRALAR